MISSHQSLHHGEGHKKPISLLNTLLYGGVISTLWYIFVNILVPYWHPGYNIQTQTVSELSAIDAPSRSLWILLCIPYTIMMIAFGWGVWISSDDNRKLKLAGALLIIDAIFGAFWPPMHTREVIAAGNGTMTDTLHVVWAYVHLVFILLIIILAAISLKRSFRIYSILTIILFLIFGALTTKEAPGLAKNEPTPFLGIWERINMAAYMIWISVFAWVLLKRKGLPGKV